VAIFFGRLPRALLRASFSGFLFRSTTGYSRSFPLEEAKGLLLATHVEDEELSTGLGFPLRLVAPGHRG
jgi:DMSO/TMAO reductase YedYZ molybdopterin-dependent catalytic subunit